MPDVKKAKLMACALALCMSAGIAPQMVQAAREEKLMAALDEWTMDRPDVMHEYLMYLKADDTEKDLICARYDIARVRDMALECIDQTEDPDEETQEVIDQIEELDEPVTDDAAMTPDTGIDDGPVAPEDPTEAPEEDSTDPAGSDTQQTPSETGPETPAETETNESIVDPGAAAPEEEETKTDDVKDPEPEKPVTPDVDAKPQPEETKQTDVPVLADRDTSEEVSTLLPASDLDAQPVHLSSITWLMKKRLPMIIRDPGLGWYQSEPDYTDEAAWKKAATGYNTPSLWGQCTWFAWGRFYEIYGFDPGFSGNGNVCVSQLVSAHPDKFELSAKPAAGAVFSSDMSHNHVGIVLAVDKATGRMLIQEGNLDGISNPDWKEACQDYRTIEIDLAGLKALYGDVTFAVPKAGKVKSVHQDRMPGSGLSLDQIRESVTGKDDRKDGEELYEAIF